MSTDFVFYIKTQPNTSIDVNDNYSQISMKLLDS
jgi:hypothetical protein